MMKISERHFFLVLVMVFIIASCGRADENQVVPAAEPTARPGATATVEKTSTKQAPTQTPTQELTQEPTVVIIESVNVDDGMVTKKCVEGIAEIGEAEDISGSIVLYFQESLTIYHNLLLFELETQEITEITPLFSEERKIFLNIPSVSPDGGYLAYQTSYFSGDDLIDSKIKIINAENEKISEINYSSSYFQWLNNDVLVIPTSKKKNPLILTEIYSGHQKYLYPILGENFWDSDFFYSWFYYGTHKNIYNSDLSRVVYPISGPNVVIRDMENDTDLITIPTITGFGSSPTWSPDGNYFAIAISIDTEYTEEYINIIDRDGEVVFQTDVSTTEMQETIYSMAWSPDSKLLGFAYVLDEPSGYTYHLGVLDVEAEKITLYCSPEVYQYTQLFWSPDNRYLLYPSENTDSEAFISYVLNIETGQTYLVMDGYFPGGWMK